MVGATIERILRGRKGLFYDVGANVGYYSLLAWASDNARPIIALEPGEAAFRAMTRNIHLNDADRIEMLRVAATNRVGQARLFSAASGDIGKSTLRNGQHTTPGTLVRQAPLDLLWAERGRPQVALLKIDVEGLEAEVLAGARQLIRENRPDLVVEFTPDLWSADLLEHTCHFLLSIGYVWTTTDDFQREITHWRRELPLRVLDTQENVVWTHSDHLWRLSQVVPTS